VLAGSSFAGERLLSRGLWLLLSAGSGSELRFLAELTGVRPARAHRAARVGARSSRKA
jgi:hypothetical protein